MNLEDALLEISKEYKIERISSTYYQIELDELFDDFNYMFIGVVARDNHILLTDKASYAELIDLDQYKKQLDILLNKYQIKFNDYYLEKEYLSNNDIKTYISFLNELREIDK